MDSFDQWVNVESVTCVLGTNPSHVEEGSGEDILVSPRALHKSFLLNGSQFHANPYSLKGILQ